MSGLGKFSFRLLSSLDDEALMRRVQARDDTRAFAELVSRWEGPIRALCVRMIGDFHRAEDLTQEVFSRVFLHRKAYRTDHRFSTYLWKSALNRCYDELRRNRGAKRVAEAGTDACREEFDKLPHPLSNPAEQLIADEEAQEIRRALNELPPSHRAIVVLKHYEGLKFREISEVLDIPQGTVKTRMTQALEKLGRMLRHRSHSCPSPSVTSPYSEKETLAP